MLTIEEQQQAEAIAIATEVEAEFGFTRPVHPNPTSLIGHEWAKYYFPNQFTRPFAFYQKEFWEWAWSIEPGRDYRPRIECEPRGVGKSTNAEAAVVSWVARQKRGMIGYVSYEEDKAGKHFDSIKALLETSELLQDYPHCRPKVQQIRNTAVQWSRDALITDSNAMIVPLSLQGSSRGWKSPTGQRFDAIVLDDIDKLGMSTALIKKLLELLKGEILAAGDDNTVILMPQNLIHRDSICSQIFDQRADILTNRIFCGPYPLLRWYDAEKIDIEGDTNNAKKWVITAGETFDPSIPVTYAEKLLNKFGRSTFDRECQQEVRKVADDRDFREWDEIYHIITYSEFRRFFERNKVPVWSYERNHPVIPQNWNVGLGLDWGTTREHPTAVAAVARPNESAPMSDSYFAFTEVILPHFPIITGEEIPLVSPGRVAAALKSGLAEWNVAEHQVKVQLMSHEASAALNTMIIDLPDELKTFFRKWKARRGSGVPQIQNVLEIDRTKPHPFRPGVPGRPRLFFVVPDGQGELIQGDVGKVYVAQPSNYKGFARARYEMPLYSQLNTGQNKIDDDFVDALRGLANAFFISSEPLTQEEILEQAMPAEYRISEMLKKTGKKHLTDTQEIARSLMEEEVRERMNLPREDPEWLDRGRRYDGGYNDTEFEPY
jgi:hypothetical protein